MYNRYIPQNDGSYRKTRIPDPPGNPPPPPRRQDPPPPPPQHRPPEPEPPKQECPREEPPRQDRPQPEPCPPPSQGEDRSVGGFLRQLLPKNFDTGDLLIILLLLLMAGDCKEDQNTALLTLALYLFL